jgi:uncharacterized OB-fold protein
MSHYCSKCGETISDGTNFCPKCGAAIEASSFLPTDETASVQTGTDGVQPAVPGAEAAKSPSFKKKLFIILAAVVVALAVGIAIFLLQAKKDPAVLIGTAVKNTANDVAATGVGGVLNGVCNGGSIELNWDMEKLLNETTDSDIPLVLDLKAYLNGKTSQSLLQASVNYQGKTVASGSLFSSNKDLALQSDQLLPDVYGVNLETIKDKLPSSIFAPDSGSAYSLPESEYNSILTTCESIQKSQGLSDETNAVVQAYAAKLLHVLCSDAKTEMSSEKVSVGKSSVDTTAVTLTMDNQSMAKLLDEMNQYTQENKELRSLVEEYVALYADASTDLSKDTEQLVDEYYSDLKDSMDRTADAYRTSKESANTKLVFYVSKSDEMLVKVDYSVTGSSKRNGALLLGKNVATSPLIEFSFSDDNDQYDIAYAVDTNSDSIYSSKLTYKNSEEESDLVFNWDKSNGTYTATVTPDSSDTSDTYELNGTLTSKDNLTTLGIDTVKMNGEEMNAGLKMILNKSDSIPTMPSYQEVVSLNEDEMNSLLSDISNRSQTLMNDLGDLSYLLYYLF